MGHKRRISPPPPFYPIWDGKAKRQGNKQKVANAKKTLIQKRKRGNGTREPAPSILCLSSLTIIIKK